MKSLLKNTLLVCASLGLAYGALEWRALSLFFHLLPPMAYPLLEDGIPPLLQHSKQGLVPRHYMALAGDSYALGLGDDYFHNAGQAAARYGSANALQELTQKDVLSFGVGGSGSIAGYVTEPLSHLAYWRASQRVHVEDPEILLLYFYEGNDLNDNVEYLHQAHKKRLPFDEQRASDSDYFQGYIRSVALEQDPLYRKAQELQWRDELYLAKFAARAAPALLHSLLPDQAAGGDDKPGSRLASPLNPPGRFEWHEAGLINRAHVGDKTLQLPDRLQGPSMDLTSAESEQALLSFREALRFVQQALPHTRLVVVYIPSVISCYDIREASVSVQSHARRQRFEFPAPAVRQRSAWIAQRVEALSREQGLAFIDSRPALRAAARQAPLHGPLDWNHFNARGYRVLAEAIAARL